MSSYLLVVDMLFILTLSQIYFTGTSIYCREKPENKADGAQKPESRQVGMRISSTTQRSYRVSE
jgi:hypothetical protein